MSVLQPTHLIPRACGHAGAVRAAVVGEFSDCAALLHYQHGLGQIAINNCDEVPPAQGSLYWHTGTFARVRGDFPRGSRAGMALANQLPNLQLLRVLFPELNLPKMGPQGLFFSL